MYWYCGGCVKIVVCHTEIFWLSIHLARSGILSILSGSGSNDGVIQYSKKESIIDNNSIIYTSGAGNLFKAGIPVGKIKKNNERSLEGKVVFFSDFSQLKFIEVLFFEKKASEWN